MKYTDQIALAQMADFVDRVQQAMITKALTVADEASSGKTGIDSPRLSLVRQVLYDPRNWAQKMAYGIAAKTSGNTDNAIDIAMTEVWNAYSGVNPKIVPADTT